MHKAVTILMLKLESEVIERNPDFRMEERDWLKRIDWEKGTVRCGDSEYLLLDRDFPTVTPENPTALTAGEQQVMTSGPRLCRERARPRGRAVSVRPRGALQICNGNLLYHGRCP